ncbi:hypothetical protein MMC34_005206 [Xylographa carneopallida]|nr:hypothetical protein [Xylographa carneopallida]
MDGDHSAKTMEAGANSAMKGGTDMVDGIHESVNQTVSLGSRPPHLAIASDASWQPAAGEKMTGHGQSVFDKSGAIGSMFNGISVPIIPPSTSLNIRPDTQTADGAIGGTAQKVGGPLDKGGMIGKHFNADGALGGTAQSLADKNKDH